MKYVVDIIEKEFIPDNGDTVYPIGNKTAVVTYYDLKTAQYTGVEYCYKTLVEIFDMIDCGRPIDLSNCYIKGFSLEEYRNSRKLEKNTVVELLLEKSRNAFFDGEDYLEDSAGTKKKCLDLSGASIISEKLDFEGSIFSDGDILFNNTNFSDCVKSFRKCKFAKTNLDFSFSRFGEGDIDFSKAVFISCDKNFSNCVVGNGDLLFVSAEFGTGDLDFSFTIIKTGNVDFSKSIFEEGTKNFSKTSFGEGNIDFSSVEFGKGDLFFLSTKFNMGNTYFLGSRVTKGNVDFFRSRFGKGNKDFSYINFGEGVVNFNHSKFSDGDVNFFKTDFGLGDLIFTKTEFGAGEKKFSNIIIKEGKVDFDQVDFGNGRVDFSRSSFGDGTINFSSSRFLKARIDFSECSYKKGELNFRDVDFGDGYVSFKSSHFEFNKVNFYNSIIPIITFQRCQFNQYTDLRVRRCDHMDLRNTIFRDIIDLKPHDNTAVKIKHLNFAEAKNSGLLFNDWKANDIKNAIVVQENTTHRQKAEQFRMMKENYHKIGQYDDEDYAYVEFKRYENKADLYEILKGDNNIFIKIITFIKFLFKWLVFDQIGHFGTSPIRVLTSMVFSFIMFSLIYLPLQQVPNFNNPEHPISVGATSIMDAAYFSAYNILLIGYDAYHPSGITGALSVVESFLGAFLMSYFTIAFVRKVLR